MTAVYLSWVFDDVRICEIERSYEIHGKRSFQSQEEGGVCSQSSYVTGQLTVWEGGGFENSNFVNRVEPPLFFYINRLQMFPLEEI